MRLSRPLLFPCPSKGNGENPKSKAIPPAELTLMAKRAHSKITYVRAGHRSMITQPCVVAGVITQAAQAAG
jgi:hypothetical protein